MELPTIKAQPIVLLARELEATGVAPNLTRGHAHEIRNALNASSLTLGYIRVLLSHEQDLKAHSAINKQLTVAQQQLVEARKLTQQKTELMRPFELQLEDHGLATLLEDVILTEKQRLAESRKRGPIHVQIVSLPEVTVRIDHNKIFSALSAIIRNAIEALPLEGGEVTLSGEILNNGRLLLEVRDTGSGFSADMHMHSLDAFVSNRPDQDGLGLTRAWLYVAAHGGDLEVANRSGAGAIVSVRLPLTP